MEGQQKERKERKMRKEEISQYRLTTTRREETLKSKPIGTQAHSIRCHPPGLMLALGKR